MSARVVSASPPADGDDYTDQHRTWLLDRVHETLDQSVIPHVYLDVHHTVTYDHPNLLGDIGSYWAAGGRGRPESSALVRWAGDEVRPPNSIGCACRYHRRDEWIGVVKVLGDDDPLLLRSFVIWDIIANVDGRHAAASAYSLATGSSAWRMISASSGEISSSRAAIRWLTVPSTYSYAYSRATASPSRPWRTI